MRRTATTCTRLPRRQRSCRRTLVAAAALYAFCREVDDVVDEVTDADVARVKLAWWRTEIDAIFRLTSDFIARLKSSPMSRIEAQPCRMSMSAERRIVAKLENVSETAYGRIIRSPCRMAPQV